MFKSAFKSLALAAIAAFGISSGAQAQAQWSYGFVNNDAQATYPGTVNIPRLGTVNCVSAVNGVLTTGICPSSSSPTGPAGGVLSGTYPDPAFTANPAPLFDYTATIGGATQTLQTKLANVRSVTDYGAVGDGVHDDTANIQAALDDGYVYLPCGTWRITAPLTLGTSAFQYIIRGEGYCSELKLDSGSNVAAITASFASLCGVSPCLQIEGVNFVTPTTATTNANTAVSITNVGSLIFDNNIIDGYYRGLLFTTSFAPIISRNIFINVKSYAVTTASAADLSFNMGRIRDNGFFSNGITTSSPAINIGASLGGLVIDGNDIEGNYSGLFLANGNHGVVISSNYFETSTSFDLFTGTVDSLNIFGNLFGSNLITSLTGITNSIFHGNYFFGGGTITFNGTTNSVKGNVVGGGSTFNSNAKAITCAPGAPTAAFATAAGNVIAC